MSHLTNSNWLAKAKFDQVIFTRIYSGRAPFFFRPEPLVFIFCFNDSKASFYVNKVIHFLA